MRPKSHICLLFTGGTIASVMDEKINALVPAKTPDQLLSLAPKLADEFDIDIIFIDNVDSTNIQSSHWTKLAKSIEQNYDKYDGFVVSHGTDTMAYSASALSYALQDLGKPVVFTGAQLPPDHISSDAKNNLVNAFRIASMDLGEVVIAFGHEIVRGNRATKQSETDFNAFQSPIYPILGKIRTEITMYGDYKRRDKTRKIKVFPEFVSDIFVLTITPSLNPKFFDLLIDNGVKGFIVNAFGTGNVPNKENALVWCIKKANEKKIPVIISSQCIGGTARMLTYEVGITALEAGGIPGADMTVEAATTKLMWALGQTNDINEVKSIMKRNISGELTEL